MGVVLFVGVFSSLQDTRRPCFYKENTLSLAWLITVEPLNKGHVGKNINSLVLSLVERLSSSRRLQSCNCIKTIGRVIIWDLKQCPL